jgi:MoaA/NifB/PqqE/SkfB family radical SAM enzyme
MANLVLAGRCDLRCPYCFAADSLAQTREAFLPPADFERRLDFLDRSGIHEARLIGGEPTLHPQFAEILAAARNRKKKVVVFSHGLFSDAVLETLLSLSPEECLVLVNLNANREGDAARKMDTLRRLGPRAMLGYTICSPDLRLEELLDAIRKTGCRKAIRIGLAHPQVSGSNAYLHPKQYPLIGARLARFAAATAEEGIRLDFDCGFVRCMFAPDDRETIRRAQPDFSFRCNPILDIDLEGRALHCFPLAREGDPPPVDGRTAAELRSALEDQFRGYRQTGVYKECSACVSKADGECTGGCLAATIRRFQPAPAGV